MPGREGDLPQGDHKRGLLVSHLPPPQFDQYELSDTAKIGSLRYVLTGGMQDWNYLHTNDFEITLEVGCYKYPPHEQLTTYWDDNREALTAYLERVHTGIKGFVVSGEDGGLLGNATIEVEGVHHDVQAAPTGDYFRLLLPGTYRVSASHPGHARLTKTVTVPQAMVDPATGMPSAKVVNFTLGKDVSEEWSKESDFGINENLETR